MPKARVDEGKPSDAQANHLSMFAEEDEPSFWDVLDVINPLQHIPIVNDIYRDLTGDKIGVGARLAGGTLFGGPIGLAAAAVNCMVEESTGKDVGGHVLALFKDDTAPDAPADTQLAQAPPSPHPAAEPAAIAAVAAPAPGAPVIELPDSGPVTNGQPMMFTLDGAQPVPAPVPATATATATATAAAPAAMQAVAQGAPRPLNGQARYMPTPNRNTSLSPSPLPQLTVPVASGSSRSNTPITGRAPNAAVPNAAASAATSAAMQRALAGQEASHPMAPPTNAGAQTAANPDWFSAAWGQALDKYQRANQLNGKPPATVSVE
ncbi:MAG: hypothetical protein H7Z12_15835 [Rhodospirillaceae bacterium]|nr:hypothetical protein [Rhodospirillales bacterium]